MSVVERLRALKTLDVHWERLATEAAAEIERLQSLVLGLRERCRIQDGLISDNADLHDEIERLRAENEGLGKELMLHDKAAELSAAENERLREQVVNLQTRNNALYEAIDILKRGGRLK